MPRATMKWRSGAPEESVIAFCPTYPTHALYEEVCPRCGRPLGDESNPDGLRLHVNFDAIRQDPEMNYKYNVGAYFTAPCVVIHNSCAKTEFEALSWRTVTVVRDV